MHDAIQHWCLAPPSVRHPLLVTRLSILTHQPEHRVGSVPQLALPRELAFYLTLELVHSPSSQRNSLVQLTADQPRIIHSAIPSFSSAYNAENLVQLTARRTSFSSAHSAKNLVQLSS